MSVRVDTDRALTLTLSELRSSGRRLNDMAWLARSGGDVELPLPTIDAALQAIETAVQHLTERKPTSS